MVRLVGPTRGPAVVTSALPVILVRPGLLELPLPLVELHEAGRLGPGPARWGLPPPVDGLPDPILQLPDFDLDAEIRKKVEELTGLRVDAKADWFEAPVSRRLLQRTLTNDIASDYQHLTVC